MPYQKTSRIVRPQVAFAPLAAAEISQASGVYACIGCGEPEHPPMVVLRAGERAPQCPTCRGGARWLSM